MQFGRNIAIYEKILFDFIITDATRLDCLWKA